jgi:methionine-rich copper-binding protein CopC
MKPTNEGGPMSARTQRRLLAATIAVALAAAPALVLGHVELVSSDPAAGSNLHTAPAEVTLTFDGELDPDGSGFTVTDHHGDEVGSGEVDLDVADRNVLAGTVSIGEPGVYAVEWTVLGTDGHEIAGSFSFGYDTDEEIPEGQGGHGHENPDTALPATSVSPATLAGLLLIILAGLVAVRRLAVR